MKVDIPQLNRVNIPLGLNYTNSGAVNSKGRSARGKVKPRQFNRINQAYKRASLGTLYNRNGRFHG